MYQKKSSLEEIHVEGGEIKFTVVGALGTDSCCLDLDASRTLQQAVSRLLRTPTVTYRGAKVEEPLGSADCCVFVALVAEGEELGHWGTVLSNAVLLTPVDVSVFGAEEFFAPSTRRTASSVTATSLSYRLMLVKAAKLDDREWVPLHALDIERKTSAPSVVPLTRLSPAGCTANISVSHFFADIVRRNTAVHSMLTHPSTGTLRPQLLPHGPSTARALVLTLYGINPRRNFDATEWKHGLDEDAANALPESATSLFTVIDVELQRTRPAKRWVVPPTTTTALFAAASNVVSSSTSPQRGTTVGGDGTAAPPSHYSRKVRGATNVPHAVRTAPAAHRASNDSPAAGHPHSPAQDAHVTPPRGVRMEQPFSPLAVVLEPLREVAVLSTNGDCRASATLPGVDPNVTAQWWTLTLDLDALSSGWTPVVVLRSSMNTLGEEHSPLVRVPLVPDLFSEHTTGVFTVPVWMGTVVTALHVQYLEVTSFVHPANHAARVRSDEMLDQLTLDTLVGHRGLGKTYTSSDATVMQQKLAENSLESFNAAHARGCQWVELDVMMTRDYTPILFHDPILQVAARGKQRTVNPLDGGQLLKPHHHDHHHRAGVTAYDTLPVAVHQLTYRQLNNALTRAYQQEDATAPSGRLRELLIKHWLELLDIAAAEGHRKDPTLASPLLIGAAYRGSGSGAGTQCQSLSSTPPLENNSSLTPRLTSSSAFLRRIDDHAEPLELPGHSPPHDGKHPPPPTMALRSPMRPHQHHKKSKGQFVDASKHQRYITNHIPTLQELFDTTPPTLRVNLEVKFPFQPKADHHLYLQIHHFEVNDFVDAILTVVFDHVQKHPDRELVFSSFEPDVCIALMLKQCRFHVLFLSDTEERSDLKDYRSYAVETAIQFAHGHHMSGISIYSLSLLEEVDKQSQTPSSSIKTWARELEKRTRVASMDDIHTLILSASAEKKEQGDDHTDLVARPNPALWSAERGRRIVTCSHAHSLKVWTWGDRNSDPYFAFVQSREMLVDAVISDNVPLWSNASVGKLQSRPPSGSLDVLAT